jgi:hypothetical protein
MVPTMIQMTLCLNAAHTSGSCASSVKLDRPTHGGLGVMPLKSTNT